MFNKKLKEEIKEQSKAIDNLLMQIDNLIEKINKLDEEIHPKYFGGK